MKNTKARLEYLLCLALSLLYLIFLDGRAGMFVLAALIAAPMASTAMTYYAKERISFALSASEKVIGKGGSATIEAVFSTTSFLPTPFISVSLFADSHLEADTNEFRITIRPKSDRTVSKSVVGAICGKGRIGISSVVISDYLGLISFTVYQESGAYLYSSEIGVTPNIPDTTLKNDLIKSVNAATASEETEESSDSVTAFGGNPGYEHREYVPGDPIKRINWKLSTKQDKLMVRLDEGTAEAKQFAILDFMRESEENSEETLIAEEVLIEGLLAFAATLAKLGKELILYTVIKNSWTELDIKTINDVYELQYMFSNVVFYTHKDDFALTRLPDAFTSGAVKASAVSIFTDCPDNNLMTVVDALEHRGTSCYTTISRPTSTSIENLWIIRDDYSFGRYI